MSVEGPDGDFVLNVPNLAIHLRSRLPPIFQCPTANEKGTLRRQAFLSPFFSKLSENMAQNPKFVMIGGFLGAGKTTTIARLAKYYQSLSQVVAIVTNDQATDLVDTSLLRSQGFEVGEVAGSCFCCNFNELTSTMERLAVNQLPDVVIAEPVGSCTDLVATVIRPLQQIYSQPIEIAPYGVLLKPSHGLRILKGGSRGGFSPQAEYIFKKQIEEADFLAINRIDELSQSAYEELKHLIVDQFPEMDCLGMSAVSGAGFSEFVDRIESGRRAGMRTMDVDYEIYAQGEAELGWLNAQVELRCPKRFALDSFLLKLVERLKERIVILSAEVAHLKVIGMAEGLYAVVNLVSSDSEPRLSVASKSETDAFDLVINARVAIDPNILNEIVRSELEFLAEPSNIQVDVRTIQSFRPGKPVPTHRI